jgi:hypothetical protein
MTLNAYTEWRNAECLNKSILLNVVMVSVIVLNVVAPTLSIFCEDSSNELKFKKKIISVSKCLLGPVP